MLVYSNNLHEKLQGIAISRDYLKYNTPFCDLVDDPNWQLDIDLAVGYNSAVTGNLSACDTFIKNLTLNSAQLDWSTLDFYVKKAKNNPLFASSIRDMQRRFDSPQDFSDSFQDALNNALKDCLNSPCNLFLETSDSVGRMAQATSTKNGNNTFGVGTMSGSFINMIDELDQTIFNKIPALFQDGFIEVAQVANKSWTNTQAVLAGKGNISELNRLAQSGSSFRNTNTVYRYTPDVKSYYDFSAAGSMVLNKIKENMGGCFDKYQYKYRYNPYTDNGNYPSRTHAVEVNGKTIEADAANKVHRYVDNNKNLQKQTGNITTLPARDITIETGKSYSDGNVAISKSFTLNPKGGGVTAHYSVFAGLIDEDEKIIWYEDYSKLYGDKLTLMGIGNLGENVYRIGASNHNKELLARAINGELSDSEISRISPVNVEGFYARGWRHKLTDEGMELLYNTPSTSIINDGVAISKTLFRRFLNDPSTSPLSYNYKSNLQLNNEFFAAIRIPNGKWHFYKVIDWNGQSDSNLDLTVGAYKHFKESNGLGKLNRSRIEELPNTDWALVKKISHDNLGPIELKICQGNIDDIKASEAFA